MVRVRQRRDAFIRGLARGGWSEADAAEHFDESVQLYEIQDAVASALEEASRLKTAYPALLVAPLLYRVENDRLQQIVDC